MKLDIEYVRQQFPQASDGFVYCSNAGGSFVAKQVLDIQRTYNQSMRIQPYSPFSPSKEGGEWMDRAYQSWSAALNISEEELTIGPSTSANSYVMSQAIGPTLTEGDEVVVTQQDHEANHGVWRRMAERAGAVVREWSVEPDTGLLDPESLVSLLNEKTRWVFFPHCSNLVGTTNPVGELVQQIRAQSRALVCVDGVAHAPHHIPDLKALDVDIYLFSLYKVYGPHQGVLYVRREVGDTLVPQCHHFLSDLPAKRFNPAGPHHAEIAASAGVIDYLQDLMAHHKIAVGDQRSSLCDALQSLHSVIAQQETSLVSPILDLLSRNNAVQLLGKAHCADGDRAPTIAFKPKEMPSATVAEKLQAQGIGAENGDFYAGRVLDGMGIDRQQGVVRLSFVHYNTMEEIEQVLNGLEQVLVL